MITYHLTLSIGHPLSPIPINTQTHILTNVAQEDLQSRSKQMFSVASGFLELGLLTNHSSENIPLWGPRLSTIFPISSIDKMGKFQWRLILACMVL